ncbi:MAG TPA: hypothetical protein VNY51_13340 [Candidatus Dormibacteraeota bacterium]|jgi:hypothetical protein|nr:hypothetical protein [Candidatus Dormibacteraeota bacterium]
MAAFKMIFFRGLWVDSDELALHESNAPILPSGVLSVGELDVTVCAALNNFGSLRLAALHHLTGATGIGANLHGKPIFTFWSRYKSVALEHLGKTYGQYSGKNTPILLQVEVEKNERVVVAADESLYEERISDVMKDTFAEFAPEDEVFVSMPVMKHSCSIVNIAFQPGDVNG